MGGLNEADRLKSGGLAAKKGSVTKLPLIQMRVETVDDETRIAHPRNALPADHNLTLWIMQNGLVSRHGIPWRFLLRERGKVDDVLDHEIGDGSRRHKAGLEAERRLREEAPGQWPLVIDHKLFPGDDKGHLFVEVDLFTGTDAEWILARIAANSEPGKLPDSTEVLAVQVAQLARHGCEDIDAIVAVMPRDVGRKEVQALARWNLLTPAARRRFVEGDLPPAVLSAVLDAPPAEQLALVEMFIANNVRTAMKATIRTKKAREEKTGEPATKGRGWKPKKLVAVANAIPGLFAGQDQANEEPAFARGFAAAFKFIAGEKTGKLPKLVARALKAADSRGGKK